MQVPATAAGISQGTVPPQLQRGARHAVHHTEPGGFPFYDAQGVLLLVLLFLLLLPLLLLLWCGAHPGLGRLLY